MLQAALLEDTTEFIGWVWFGGVVRVFKDKAFHPRGKGACHEGGNVRGGVNECAVFQIHDCPWVWSLLQGVLYRFLARWEVMGLTA